MIQDSFKFPDVVNLSIYFQKIAENLDVSMETLTSLIE